MSDFRQVKCILQIPNDVMGFSDITVGDIYTVENESVFGYTFFGKQFALKSGFMEKSVYPKTYFKEVE